MQNGRTAPNRRKNQSEHSQTLIIPKLSPEMLEKARRAAEAGTPLTEEQAQAALKAEKAAKAGPTAAPMGSAATPRPRKSTTGQRSELTAEEQLRRRVHDDHLWLNNPLMIRGLGLAPIVVVATTAQNSWMLCVAAALLLVGTRMLASVFCRLTGNRGRALIYCYSAAILYVPVYLILYALFGTALTALGIYLPLLAVEPAIIKKMESTDEETPGEALRKGVNNSVGLCVSILLVGCLRELLAAGTLFGHTVFHVAALPIASMPAGGFILVGILSALWVGVANQYVRFKKREVKAQYADRKR